MLLSVVVPAYCEEASIIAHYNSFSKVFYRLKNDYPVLKGYEYIVIDNCSTDKTVEVALSLRSKDPLVKVLVNDKNYGPVASPFDAMMKAKGDAVLLIAADLQEPPELLEQFLPALLEGYDAAIGYKEASRENPVMWWLRGRYYWLMKCLGMTTIPERYSGFGLYSRRLVEAFRADRISEPSLRVLLPRNATSIQSFPYVHQQRHQGKSSYSVYGYSREAIKNIVRNSRNLPHLTGKLAGSTACIAIGSVPLMVMAKLVAWQAFAPGIATVFIVVLLFFSLILAFIAVILDRLDQILLRLDPPSRTVKQSAVYD